MEKNHKFNRRHREMYKAAAIINLNFVLILGIIPFYSFCMFETGDSRYDVLFDGLIP